MLALRYLAKDQEGFDASEIGGRALAMAEDPAVNLLNRVSAIQVASTVAGRTGDGARYRKFAEAGNAMPMRLAAIAALGQSGDQSQRPFLEDILSTGKEPLAAAARHAIKKLSR